MSYKSLVRELGAACLAYSAAGVAMGFKLMELA
jgi:hypothetical protein